jgi:H+/Cl- antiporter ClcA
MNTGLFIEAIAVGILLVPLGYLVLYGSVELSKRYKSVDRMDKNIKMSLGFFILGILTHLFCELTGINKWYCKKGVACQ